ncbi:MAG: discoidin domain-containing protein [Lysobacteraceae bacterium]
MKLTMLLASSSLMLLPFAEASAENSRLLDAFSDPTPWRVIASTQVTGKIRADAGALCLDYDFNGVSGYVGMQRDLPLDYPDNYRFDLRLRGDSPTNDLQFKLIDASGDNVWWVNRPKYAFPHDWTDVRYKRRMIGKAWGPGSDPMLHASAKLEFTLNNSAGGKGTVCFDDLRFTALPADVAVPRIVSAHATARARDAAKAIDGVITTAWTGGRGMQRLKLDLGQWTEFGGLRLDWTDRPADYAVLASDDGHVWRKMRTVSGSDGGRDWIATPESEARYIAIESRDNAAGLVQASVEPLAFAATPNAFVAAVAQDQPRGRFPRGFSGEQPYWTILGVDGGREQGLIGEDGAIEVAKGGFSLEPFMRVDDTLLDWAGVATAQSLQDGFLPIPSVDWTHADASLRTTAFVDRDTTGERTQLVARYVLTNPSTVPHDYVLALAVQPLQVNPPGQFLNTTGGVSRIASLAIGEDGVVQVDGKSRVYPGQAPDAAFATPFDAGMASAHLASGAWPATRRVDDATGLASGALLYRWRLQPGESREVDVVVPFGGTPFCEDDACTADQRQRAVAGAWRAKLGEVHFTVPAEGKPLVDTLRTALAHQLISRVGPRLQPGTRSYARSWIRDGAMISEALLRMGRSDAVRDYLDWYAPYQFDNGKVPCCVDDRGSDPVPENDSHGELIFAIAEYARHTGDEAFLRRMWPHVRAAFAYMETLSASERTEENRARDPAFYGLMPVSISHEGYSAKPMHAYWDDFWALRGYKDAAWIAQRLGETADAARMAAARDRFADDLHASLRLAAAKHGIDYLPGAVELGDFDPTSTTIALAPGGEQARLPQALLQGTFERYWREFVQRRDGQRNWKNYTPYEWRNVGAFVRLGWRDRAWEAVQFFFADRAPQAWNQWGEVVSRTPRAPFFLGDLPHAWVASDFVRSALDLFAYGREDDDAIVLAAGIPARWLDGEGIGIDGLRTPQGTLGYTLLRTPDALELTLSADTRLPSGGAVLPWPLVDVQPGRTTVDSRVTTWRDGALRIPSGARRVRVSLR